MLSSKMATRLANWIGEGVVAKYLRQWADQQTKAEQALSLADQAMYRARYQPLQSALQLTNIGLLAYHNPQSPKLYQAAPLPNDTRWLRPFIEILPQQPLNAEIRLSILDSKGQILFSEVQRLSLHQKTHLVTRNWLPMTETKIEPIGRWVITVALNGALMAIHPFEWVKVGEEAILELMYEDGEISETLQQEVRQGKFRKMSLNELLSDQKD